LVLLLLLQVKPEKATVPKVCSNQLWRHCSSGSMPNCGPMIAVLSSFLLLLMTTPSLSATSPLAC
jgi:hypothetical protein